MYSSTVVASPQELIVENTHQAYSVRFLKQHKDESTENKTIKESLESLQIELFGRFQSISFEQGQTYFCLARYVCRTSMDCLRFIRFFNVEPNPAKALNNFLIGANYRQSQTSHLIKFFQLFKAAQADIILPRSVTSSLDKVSFEPQRLSLPEMKSASTDTLSLTYTHDMLNPDVQFPRNGRFSQLPLVFCQTVLSSLAAQMQLLVSQVPEARVCCKSPNVEFLKAIESVLSGYFIEAKIPKIRIPYNTNKQALFSLALLYQSQIALNLTPINLLLGILLLETAVNSHRPPPCSLKNETQFFEAHRQLLNQAFRLLHDEHKDFTDAQINTIAVPLILSGCNLLTPMKSPRNSSKVSQTNQVALLAPKQLRQTQQIKKTEVPETTSPNEHDKTTQTCYVKLIRKIFNDPDKLNLLRQNFSSLQDHLISKGLFTPEDLSTFASQTTETPFSKARRWLYNFQLALTEKRCKSLYEALKAVEYLNSGIAEVLED
ncbi:hypothetical protein [Parashewanella curva]|nr:hypothetical protein [Parashewanella curva]